MNIPNFASANQRRAATRSAGTESRDCAAAPTPIASITHTTAADLMASSLVQAHGDPRHAKARSGGHADTLCLDRLEAREPLVADGRAARAGDPRPMHP